MAYLNWITDDALFEATHRLLLKAREIEEKSKQNLNKNVIDPFSSLFQMAGFQLSYSEWLIGEITRQAQKSFQNHIGDFHQYILGSVVGWENKGVGEVIDLVNSEHKLIAEVKNKHNTVKGSDLVGLYDTLSEAVTKKMSVYKGYTSYYVTIIPSKSERFNKPFTPSDNKMGQKREVNENIRIIDGASFYELATGDSHALRNLFNILPDVVSVLIDKKFDQEERVSLLALFNKAYG